jgi:hypothetical protein
MSYPNNPSKSTSSVHVTPMFVIINHKWNTISFFYMQGWIIIILCGPATFNPNILKIFYNFSLYKWSFGFHNYDSRICNFTTRHVSHSQKNIVTTLEMSILIITPRSIIIVKGINLHPNLNELHGVILW